MIRLQITAGLLLVVATMFITLFVGVNDLTVRLEETTQSQHAQSIENGAKLFEVNCKRCHGAYGEGKIGPTLNTPVLFDTGSDGRIAQLDWTGSVENFIKSTISAGRPGTLMQPWSQEFGGPLRGDEIQALTDFIMNWEATAGEFPEGVERAEPTPIPEDQLVSVGEELFVSQGCNACHTIEGKSQGVVGPELTHIATVAEERAADLSLDGAEMYIRQSIVDPGVFIVSECPTGPCPTGTMPTAFGNTLSKDQIDALVAYLMEQK